MRVLLRNVIMGSNFVAANSDSSADPFAILDLPSAPNRIWGMAFSARRGGHPMKSRQVWMIVALLLVASGGGGWADTSDVKGAAPLIVGKRGKHCKDDPHCFNRHHFAIKPAARV